MPQRPLSAACLALVRTIAGVRRERWTAALLGLVLGLATSGPPDGLVAALAAPRTAVPAESHRPGGQAAGPLAAARTAGNPVGAALAAGGSLLQARGRACLVVGHPRRAALVHDLAGECDAAVLRVTAVWGRSWRRRAIVLLADDAVELGRLVSVAGDLDQVAALTTGSADEPDRVFVNAAAFGRLTPVGRRVVLAHELLHVATASVTGPQLPTWLVEGLADEVGYLGQPVPLERAAAELRADVRAGRVPIGLPSDRAFAGTTGLPQAYQASWLAVRWLVDRYGQAAVQQLYRRVGTDPHPGALDRGLRPLGLTTATLTAGWRADLLHRFG